MSRRVSWMGGMVVGLTLAVTMRADVSASASEIVLYASEAPVVQGHWRVAESSGAASGRSTKSPDSGFSSTTVPLVSPANYFELTFEAQSATTYRVWLRLRSHGSSKWNDSVWVQFDDATTPSGAPAYRIGTTSALMVNLERCSGCGMSEWGWHNTAYWLTQETAVRFAATGRRRMRIQTREDGVEIDQVVLSPARYLDAAPGSLTNDITLLPKATVSDTTTTPTAGALAPYKGAPVMLPGTISAVDFDEGGSGVAFSDTTFGNSGAVYRSTDVDIQSASIGGYNVGWTTPGEWLKYTVNVAAAGHYKLMMRVAAPLGHTVDVTVGSATATLSVPSTGGWQNWTTVATPVALAAGQQVMTVKFSTGGVNLHSVTVAPITDDTTLGTHGKGGTLRVMTWNVHHGKNTAGQLSVPAQARFIASHQPHVVALQEVQTWDQNQPAMFKAELERITGVPWNVQWAPVQSSQWTEGNLLLSRLPVTAQSMHRMHATSDWTVLLANRSVAHMTVAVGGVPVHVFSTHLDYANTSYRTAQLLDMMAWTEKFGAKRIVAGDFNSTPGTYWINTMTGDYYDTWQEVTGRASGGGTINGVRFDYQFRSKFGADNVMPISVMVGDSTLSDHKPVIADYLVRP